MEPEDGTPDVVESDDTAVAAGDEDRFDTLEDAVKALTDDEEGSDEEPEEEPEPEEDPDLAEVELNDEKVTLKALKEGFLRQRDYTAKTTEVAQERKALETQRQTVTERAQVLEAATNNILSFVERLVPPEPDRSLMASNPGEYLRQQALRQSAMEEIKQLVDVKGALDSSKQAVSAAELARMQAEEQSKLIRSFPKLADPVARAKFDESVKMSAKAFGFTDDEIGATFDHRVLRMVHYANIGMRAEQNRNNAAKRAEQKPAVQGKTQATATTAQIEQKKAMSRLAKTGSFADGLKALMASGS